jgi:hypothetical protein
MSWHSLCLPDTWETPGGFSPVLAPSREQEEEKEMSDSKNQESAERGFPEVRQQARNVSSVILCAALGLEKHL